MTSISATLQISAGDLSNLAALPQQLEALVGFALHGPAVPRPGRNSPLHMTPSTL